MEKTILITGGAGFIRIHLADELLELGYHVRVLDNLSAQVHGQGRSKPSYLDSEVELIIGDVRHCFADISLARGVLDYEPRVSLDEGLRELVIWLEGQVAVDRVEEASAELSARNFPACISWRRNIPAMKQTGGFPIARVPKPCCAARALRSTSIPSRKFTSAKNKNRPSPPTQFIQQNHDCTHTRQTVGGPLR